MAPGVAGAGEALLPEVAGAVGLVVAAGLLPIGLANVVTCGVGDGWVTPAGVVPSPAVILATRMATKARASRTMRSAWLDERSEPNAGIVMAIRP